MENVVQQGQRWHEASRRTWPITWERVWTACRGHAALLSVTQAAQIAGYLSEVAKVSFRHRIPSVQSRIASAALKFRSRAIASPTSMMMA